MLSLKHLKCIKIWNIHFLGIGALSYVLLPLLFYCVDYVYFHNGFHRAWYLNLRSHDIFRRCYICDRYEDMAALDGGDDGMDVIRIILEKAPSMLQPDGSVQLLSILLIYVIQHLCIYMYFKFECWNGCINQECIRIS